VIYLAAGELLLIAALVWFIAHRENQHAKTLLELMAAQDAERAGLLNRIQRPDLLPTPRSSGPVEPRDPPPDLAKYRKVGTVRPLRDETPTAG
jgi:hypothetical protein